MPRRGLSFCGRRHEVRHERLAPRHRHGDRSRVAIVSVQARRQHRPAAAAVIRNATAPASIRPSHTGPRSPRRAGRRSNGGRRRPRCNWGVATGIKSGVFVVDVDPYHAGAETLASLEDEFGPLPATWEVLTGGGGRHLYFRYPTRAFKSTTALASSGPASTAAAMADWSSRRQAATKAAAPMPGTSTPTPTSSRSPICRHGSSPGSIDRRQANGRPPEEWLQLVTDPVTESRRSDRLVKLAGHLLRRFVDPVVTLELLTSWNAARCSPPIDDAELKEAIERICELEMTRRRGGSHG